VGNKGKRAGGSPEPSATPPARRRALMQEQFREDLRFWIAEDPRMAERLMRIVEDTIRDPFSGLGKPEPLRHVFTGCWSRRLTAEHRVVYRVTDEAIDFLQARYHY
jgi:toxin YoeB